MFVDLDNHSLWQKRPELGDLSVEDREFIGDQRHRVEVYLSKRDVQDAREDGLDVLENIALVWPDASRSHYFVELEHATSRHTIGAFAGQKRALPKRGRKAFDRGVMEYGCCILMLEDRLTIEVMRMAACPDQVLIAMNGCIDLELPLRGPLLPWRFAPSIEEPYEVRQAGEVYGTIRNESTWNKFDLAIVRRDGFRMPLPLQFGSSTAEVLMILWRLITLKPLWSRSMPVNRSRVIDPVVGSAVSREDCLVYFSVSLYFVASVYGEQILGGAGG